MCNACGFYCCAFDSFDGCGCDCPSIDCRMVRCDYCGRSTDGAFDDCPCGDEDFDPDPYVPECHSSSGASVVAQVAHTPAGTEETE